MMRRWRTIAAATVGAILGSGSAAADPSDRIAIERALAQIARSPDAPAAVREVTAARLALVRARQGGSEKRAALWLGLAKQWAENAQALLVARQAEASLAATEQRLNAVTDQIAHARVLLEEIVARRERAANELHQAEAEPGRAAESNKRPATPAAAMKP